MISDLLYKSELRGWIKNVPFICPFAVTLTMKPNNSHFHSQSTRHFSNRLNQSYLQNSYRRQGKRLTVIPIKEGNSYIHTHFHLIIDNPYKERSDEFVGKVKSCWAKTGGSLPRILVEEMRDDIWIAYITKFKSKSNYRDCVDWDNVWVN